MLMRKIATFIVVSFLIAAGAFAADTDQEKKPGPSVAEWLKNMQRKIEAIVPRRSMPLSTGVAGVRGAKEDAQVQLYWKGKKDEESVSEEELAVFRTAIELASSGKNADAVKELEEFITEFPNSPLIPDATKMLDLVKADQKGPSAKDDAGSKTGQQ